MPSHPLPQRTLRRTILLLVAVATMLAGTWYWKAHVADAGTGRYRTVPVERGDIRVAISATGTLEAISTVDVGSQVSGQVTQVLVDFNDRVHKGEVLARLDPSTYQAQIAQGAAATASARASLASAQATLRNADLDFARKAQLAQRQLVARSDADQAAAARGQARAQVDVARAQIAQQQASTRTAELGLQRTVIRSPVDGVVLTRTIEPGQTVAASLQAPVLFQLAEDLSQMQIILAIDEADIGQVKAGQAVLFNVDAFPGRQFRGKVQQVRLAATNVSNVITYPAVVSVDNSSRVLLPGMTANAEIQISHRDNVLRVPNAALRFKPDETTTAAAPAPRAGAGGMTDELVRTTQTMRLDAAQQAAFDAALAAMRERSAARQAQSARGGSTGTPLFGGPGGGGRPAGNNNNGDASQAPMRQRMLERIKQQFNAFRASLDPARQQQWDAALTALATARRAPLYVLVDGKPQQVMVRIGASDGSNTEVSGDIREGMQVIVGVDRAPAQ